MNNCVFAIGKFYITYYILMYEKKKYDNFLKKNVKIKGKNREIDDNLSFPTTSSPTHIVGATKMRGCCFIQLENKGRKRRTFGNGEVVNQASPK